LIALEDFARFPVTQPRKDALMSKLNIQNISQLLDDDSHADLACRVLCKLMPESTTLLRNEGTALWLVGLGHRNHIVRKTTLDILNDLANQDGGMQYMSEQSLLPAILQCLRDSSIKVSNTTSDLLIRLSADKEYCVILFEKCKSELEELIKGDDAIARLRVLELLSKIWALSAECAEVCRQTGAKDQLLLLSGSDDCLLQLNAVEILSSLPAGEVKRPADFGNQPPRPIFRTTCPKSTHTHNTLPRFRHSRSQRGARSLPPARGFDDIAAPGS
jgi:hypothetical protein